MASVALNAASSRRIAMCGLTHGEYHPLFVTRYSANSKFNGLPGSFFSFILVVGTSARTISNLVLFRQTRPAPLSKDQKGGSHVGGMTVGIVATRLVFFPAAPLFLLMHGKDTTIPKSAEVTAYVNGDLKLNPAKFIPAAESNGPIATDASKQ
jgi:hypothetical protein